MAERRMFSKTVIGAARFLTMPPSSRLLYYDLGMSADDDGIVEAFTVMRTTGAADDDLRVLVSKGFVKLLNEELVAYITDWNRNNHIRKDRYQQSIYSELLVQIENGNQRLTNGLPNGNQRLTQDSIDKDSIDKDSLEKSSLGKGIMDNGEKDKGRTFTSPPQSIFAEPVEVNPEFEEKRNKAMELLDSYGG